MPRFMEENLPCISFKRSIRDTHSFELSQGLETKNTSGDELQKKKGILNILLLNFDFFCFV